MANTFDGYIERWQTAFDVTPCMWRNHVLGEVSTQVAILSPTLEIMSYDWSQLEDLPVDEQAITIPIKTYAGVWTEATAPEPEVLGKFLSQFLDQLLIGGEDAVIGWYKSEGAYVLYQPGMEFLSLDGEPNYKLIVRQMWELEIERNFDTRELRLFVNGRFGVYKSV